MDKIDRSKYNMYMMGDSPVVKNMDKIDELVEGYNDLKEAYHSEMSVVESRIEEIMKRLENMENRMSAQTLRLNDLVSEYRDNK